jgi:hypothetical protein
MEGREEGRKERHSGRKGAEEEKEIVEGRVWRRTKEGGKGEGPGFSQEGLSIITHLRAIRKRKGK